MHPCAQLDSWPQHTRAQGAQAHANTPRRVTIPSFESVNKLAKLTMPGMNAQLPFAGLVGCCCNRQIPAPGLCDCAGVEALNLAKWPIGGHQEQAIMSSIGHMWRITQLDLADSLVSLVQCTHCHGLLWSDGAQLGLQQSVLFFPTFMYIMFQLLVMVLM